MPAPTLDYWRSLAGALPDVVKYLAAESALTPKYLGQLATGVGTIGANPAWFGQGLQAAESFGDWYSENVPGTRALEAASASAYEGATQAGIPRGLLFAGEMGVPDPSDLIRMGAKAIPAMAIAGRFGRGLDEAAVSSALEKSSARIGGDAVALDLIRYQHPSQQGLPSMRGSVHYTAASGGQMSPYSRPSAHRSGYGGSHRRDVQREFSNPVYVRGGQGGRVLHNAYDEVAGKGSYDRMRDSVLRSMPQTGDASARYHSAFESMVEHGVDDELAHDLAEQISQHATKGNQYAYAVQEAIAADHLRRAGFDAVIGIGPRSKTLSEVVSLKDAVYPALAVGVVGAGSAMREPR